MPSYYKWFGSLLESQITLACTKPHTTQRWKHFTTAAACSFPLDATSLFVEQIPVMWVQYLSWSCACSTEGNSQALARSFLNSSADLLSEHQTSLLALSLLQWPHSFRTARTMAQAHTPCHSMPTLPATGIPAGAQQPQKQEEANSLNLRAPKARHFLGAQIQHSERFWGFNYTKLLLS